MRDRRPRRNLAEVALGQRERLIGIDRAGNGERLTAAWLDAGYSFWLDDNPVAMAAGRNQADAENRLANERLGGGFTDLPNSQIGWYSWRWRS